MENINGWIDVTVPISDGMVHWPEQPDISVTLFESIKRGDVANVSMLSMMVHTGTHMDAPLHFIDEGKDITEVPLESLLCKVKVIEVKNDFFIEPEDFAKHNIAKGDRIIFKTKNSNSDWSKKDFKKNFVHLSVNAAKKLSEIKIDLLGVDYLSIGGLENGTEVHRLILGARIWVIEGLDLRNISEGLHEMICLPLKIQGCDGAPARVLLKTLK